MMTLTVRKSSWRSTYHPLQGRGNRQERVIPNLIWSAVIIVGVAVAVALLSLLGH
jgi:hypothetical protein